MKAMVEVVRIEDETGIGPWQSPLHFDVILSLRERFNETKNPRHCRRTVPLGSYEINDFLFGFRSHRDLKDYFGEELIEVLLAHGFRVRTYWIKDEFILQGDGEIAFPKPGVTPQKAKSYDFFDKLFTERIPSLQFPDEWKYTTY